MIVAYIRTYSNDQNAESQKNAIEQYSSINTMVIDKWYRNTRNSSSSSNYVEEIIKDLHMEDTLIIADITRLSRRLMEIMHLILLSIERKVTILSLREGYIFENNANSKTQAFTFGLISEIESELISARTKEAQTICKNKGIKLGCPQSSAPKSYLMSKKSQIEKDLRDANTTYAELAEFYHVSLSGFKRFVREHISNVPTKKKK